MPRTPSPEDADLHKKARRAGIASFIGTTIEWYDFYIYGLAAALVFGKVFFPADMDPGLATLLSFVTLWSGFIARPLGGIIFGHLGDRIGRKTTLVITLIMMGIATTCIGLLPVYTQIGIWAPISLVALRIVQGIAVGGEWGGAILIASESAPKGKGILYAAFAQQGSPTGNLLATLAFFALSALPASDFILWGWRAPFLLSAVLVIVGMVIRLKLEESEDMKRVLAQKRTVKLPLAEVLGKHWKIVLLGAGVLPIIHVTYFKSTFALSWATKTLGYSQGTFLSIIVVALVVQFLSQPLGALLTSRIDMRKAACLMVLPEFILMPAMFFAVETKVYWIARCRTRCSTARWAVSSPEPSRRGCATPACRWPTSSAHCWSAAVRRYWPSGFSTVPAASSAWPWPRPATRWSRWPVPWPCCGSPGSTPATCRPPSAPTPRTCSGPQRSSGNRCCAPPPGFWAAIPASRQRPCAARAPATSACATGHRHSRSGNRPNR